MSIQNELNKVKLFHDSFNEENGLEPQLIPESKFWLRHKLMAEENKEYLEACKEGDLVEIADALGDQLYILCGSILKHGMQHIIEDVFTEIHRSNMTKLDADGLPIFRLDGKIIKSKLYQPPNIADILNETSK